MCIPNEEIHEILATQRRRFLARVRYYLRNTDPWGKPYTRAGAERAATFSLHNQISYEEFIKKEKWHVGGYFREPLPEIVRTRCPIPYMPEMPITKCLECTSPLRRA